MLKNMVVVAVTALLASIALSAQPNKDPSEKKRNTPTENPPVVLSTPNRQDDGNTKKTGPSANPPGANTSIPDPNWVLVVVGAITASVVGWQSYETRKAATAALLNAQAVINAERAWMIVNIEPFRPETIVSELYFRTVCVNRGKTPAIVLSFSSETVICHSPDDLPSPALYPEIGRTPTSAFIVTGDSFTIEKELRPSSIWKEAGRRKTWKATDNFVIS